MRHILVVDDEPAICDLVQLALEADGSCRVTCASSAGAAAAILQRDPPEAAIIDAVLPQLSGLQLARQFIEAGVPVLIVTGEPATRAKLENIDCPYLAKPFPINVLLAEANALLDEAAQRRAQLALLLPRLLAKSTPLRVAVASLRDKMRRRRFRRSHADGS